MFEEEKNIQQLVRFLRKKNTRLSDEELEKVARQFLGIGSFVVQMQIKKYSESSNPQNSGEDFEMPPKS